MSLSAPLPSDVVGLSVSVDVAAGSVTLIGEFDHCSAHLLTDAATALEHGTAADWTVDAAGVTFCDGGGLAALIGLREQALRRGCTLRLVRASSGVQRLIRLVGLTDRFPIGPVPRPVPSVPARGARCRPLGRPGRRRLEQLTA